MKKTLLLLVCLLFSGCATVYTNPARTGADFEKDMEACMVVAKKELADKGAHET